MAKLFRHLGIGGKKVSDQQPCHQELMSGKTSSGSVQELRSTSPSKNRASAIVVSSNSWLGAGGGIGPDVNADGRRHSDASSIRNLRSRLSTHPRLDLNSRGTRSRGAGSTRYAVEQCDGRGGGLNGARSPCARPDCVRSSGISDLIPTAGTTTPSELSQKRISEEDVASPQIATEYSDPFDLKQQIQASEEKAKPDVKPYWSEDDYCVPYDVQNESAKDPTAKGAQDETKMSPIAKPESSVCSSTANAQKMDEVTTIPASSATSSVSCGALVAAAAPPEKLQNDDPPSMDDTPSTETGPDLVQDLDLETGCAFGSTLSNDPEGGVVLINQSIGMYDAPWDLWATQKQLEEKLKAAQTPPPQGTTGRPSLNPTLKECGATAAESSVVQKSQYGDATAQIYDAPWDKMAENLQQSFFRADQEFVQRSATCEASMMFGSLGHDPHCASHRPDMKLKQCRSVGDQHKMRTSIRTGVGSCYSQHSPMCTVQREHSLRCRHSPEFRHSTSHPLPDCVDERLPLEKQTWYHGSISRVAAEALLRSHREGSYLVRTSESNKLDYSLSLKSSCGDFMHMKIVQQNSRFILGQFSQPFDSIPQMILYYTINKLPIRGTEHMTLSFPVCSDIL